MRVLIIFENLRGFMTSRPPIVMFIFCLGVFAVALLTLAYIVKIKDIKNLDEKDWNDFLSGFKNVQFCMVPENNFNHITTTKQIGSLDQRYVKDIYAKVHENMHSKINGEVETSTEFTTDLHEDVVLVSLPLWVEVRPTLTFVSIPHNVTHLSTVMSGRQMAFLGEKENFWLNVTFTLPYHWNTSMCKTKDDCKTLKIQTCVQLQAPAKLFPRSRKPNDGFCETMNSTGGVENHFKMVGKQRSEVRPIDIVCENMPGFTVTHETDPNLTLMLTLQDHSVINLHLMHTSYFLFVMVITMFTYALVRGKPHIKVKNVQYLEVSTQA